MTSPAQRQKYRTSPWILLGAIGIFLLFGVLGGWAATTRISGAIIAKGIIGVESKVKTVQHLEGGIVGKIFVRNGDRVKAGDLLLRLDDTTAQANFAIVSGSLHELHAKLARLRAERDASTKITFPDSLVSKNATPELDIIVRGQKSLFEARKKGRRGQVSILRQRILQLNELIKGLEKQQAAQTVQMKILAQSYDRKLEASLSGAVSGDTLDSLNLKKAQMAGEIGKLRSEIAKSRGSISEIEEQIVQVDTEFREQVLSDIRETQIKINESQEKKTALEEQLRRMDIRAPQTGRIHNMSIFTIGGVISPAKPVLQIIPENDRLIVECKIETTDIDQIKIGQEAAINLSAFDASTTPQLTGVVKKISAAQITDPNNSSTFFTVEIILPQSELARLEEGQELLPGMPAEVFIRTEDRTPLDYLLKPLWSQIERAARQQ